MPTYEQMFYLREASRWQRFRRDLRLLRMLAKVALIYIFPGTVIRRRYKSMKARGETFWLD